MASSQKIRNFKTREFRDTELEERDQKTMFDGFYGKMREKRNPDVDSETERRMEKKWALKAEQKKEEKTGSSLFHLLMAQKKDMEEDVKIVLQQLIVIARLPYGADGTELGAHYEKLNFQLSKQYIWDNITGLLLIYPSCLLHIIESSRDILVSVLKDLTDMQQQANDALLDAPKVVFMAHDSQSRLFHQWSHKVLEAAQMHHRPKRLQEEEESTATMVCTVLSALQSLSKHPDIYRKALPGSVLDKNPELSVPQEILETLLNRDELQNPQQYLQLYNSPLKVSMDFGCATTDESWDVLGASSPGGRNH